ncbi:class I SAM-dependent methyltransferase [Bacillus sp. JCM 19041]|uniref:class I SAM-dependent methyltransferase n=1 Tax=Bacillus sp. JCM 19041 TaxID=1460637 RepID=UPI000ADD559C
MVELCKQKGLKAEVMSFEALEVEANRFDAIWGLNCLLHLPKARLGLVLEEMKRVLKPDGLFYLGVYGGKDSEGIWEEDFYEPKRFFSFFKDEDLLAVVSEYFKVDSFQVIPSEVIGGTLHFQACLLRKVVCLIDRVMK